jgi:hypothetical protein
VRNCRAALLSEAAETVNDPVGGKEMAAQLAAARRSVTTPAVAARAAAGVDRAVAAQAVRADAGITAAEVNWDAATGRPVPRPQSKPPRPKPVGSAPAPPAAATATRCAPTCESVLLMAG